jgi:hypothetical protein
MEGIVVRYNFIWEPLMDNPSQVCFNLAYCFQRRRTKNEKLMTDGQLQGGKT